MDIEKCSDKQKEGVKLFMEASKLERAGEIGHAMELYGKAYRLDPEVEAHIDYKTLVQDNNTDNKQVRRNSDETIEEDSTPFDIDYPNSVGLISAALCGAPMAQQQPLGLSDDIWLRVMMAAGTVHAPSVDVIGRSCRKAYLISRQDHLWRHLYNLATASSRLSAGQHRKYISDYRRAFLSRPRLRTDGLYINKITYFRSGLSFTSLNNPVHLVTYYRYLRFFGAGSNYGVWWLITSKPPKDVLDHLRKPLKDSVAEPLALDFASLGVGQFANFFYGHYQRLGDDPESPEFELKLASPKDPSKIKWHMKIRLDPSKRKRPTRHGSLQCIDYTSVGSVFTSISTADWRSFVFSKVKSYHT